jgi:competence protein ComEC
VIDTGDGKNKAVTTYLKSRGLKTIDLLILTHNHIDHNGEAMSIIKEFTVNNIVISAYDNSEIKNLPHVVKVKAKDILTSGKLTFEVLHPDKGYENENDNSLVLYTKIGDLRFIFMGDCSVDVERKFSSLNVDVLKVGHHGSITSTSRDFVSSLKPEYAIIQTGRIKQFGFPHQPVIENLLKQKVIIYRTDLHYSIKYTYNNRRSVFVTMNQ